MPILSIIRPSLIKKCAAVIAGAVTVAAVASAPADASQHSQHRSHDPSVKVLLSGLTAAKAVNTTPDGNVVFADQNSRGGGTLKIYVTHGRHRGHVFSLANFREVPSDVAYAGHGGFWILFGAASEEGPPPPGSPANNLFRWSPKHGGKLMHVANLGAYAASHPDPFDQEDNPGESNAYGLTPLRDGSVLIADAAANAVRRVTPWGHIQTVAHLPVQMVSTSHLPPGSGLPPKIPAEAVATSVAVGPDGAWYVSELKGFPFRPGTSRIWRIRPGTHDAVCDPKSKHAACSLYASGFTSVIDITFGAHGDLYAVEFARGGVGAVENAPEGTPPPPGLLIKLHHGQKSELVRGKITLPGGIAFDKCSGDLFVTDFQLVPKMGRLLRIG